MLYLHRSERADGLLVPLADILAEPLDDPFAAEFICVPTRGIERWISQGLACHLGTSSGNSDGISANIQFPPPGALVAEIVSRASGRDPKTDPWFNGRSLWALLDAIDANMAADWMALVADQINVSEQRGVRNRVSTARYIADLFTRYSELRPEMVQSWARGGAGSSGAEVLPERLAWQPRLWREMRERLGTPSPPEMAAQVCAKIAGGEAELELPERISAFGLTRISASQLKILRAVSVKRDVHLFLLHPSPQMWDAVNILPTLHHGIPARSNDQSRVAALNPLLASWARDTREMQVVLTSGDRQVASQQVASQQDIHHPIPEPSNEKPTLLQRLQADVYANTSPPSSPDANHHDDRPEWDPDTDNSVQVHACHGPGRQVEVLRDVILDLLDSDPTLEPRDVIVMCPDVDTFAPLIHATFGATPQLRVRLADRALNQSNPLLAAVVELLAVIDSQASASQVTSLMGAAPVRERFGFADDDLARIHDWVANSGIRWGLDEAHRDIWHVPGVEANTWRAGLDRILLGVAMADQDLRMVGSVRPLDDVNSNDITLIGYLTEFVTRLATSIESLREPMTLNHGLMCLITSVDALMLAKGRDAWQREELQRIIDELAPEDGEGVGEMRMSFAELRDLLTDQMIGRPTRANFRTGHITVATLMPMRSVPHRVVCLLGLDDGTFPRTSRRSGDDLTQEQPRVGDHDGRGEDRQLLLDALLAATDTLVATYSGRDERSNAVKQPAVPLAELLTVIGQTVKVTGERGVVTEHPLQSFDVRNFIKGSLVARRSFSYDGAAFKGALASTEPKQPAPPFLDGPIAAQLGSDIDLDALVAFVEHPVKAFVSQQLGINLADYDKPLVDKLDISMDGLKEWGAGQHLVEALTSSGTAPVLGEEGLKWYLAEIASGQYPPGDIVVAKMRGLYKPAAVVATATRLTRGKHPGVSMPVRTQLPDDRWVIGSVAGVYDNQLIETTFSRLEKKSPKGLARAKVRISTWVRLLAVAASYPDQQFSARIIGRDVSGQNALMFDLCPPGDPGQELAQIVDLYERNSVMPLPLFADTSHAYVWGDAKGKAEAYVGSSWTSPYGRELEDQDDYHQMVMDPVPTASDLLQDGDFVDCAHQLWDMMLTHEKVVRPS